MDDRAAFLAAIDASPESRCDCSLRGIFADWLDEHGDHEEAKRQRGWDDVMAASRKWLEDFALNLRPYDDEHGAAKACDRMLRLLEEGSVLSYGSDMYGRQSFLDEFPGAEDFLHHVEIATGVRYDPEDLTYRCSC